MSIEVINNHILRFLSSDEPEVLAIKGEWGVGKTYNWVKTLDHAKANNLIALNKYSYVSLFGINSLESLKFSIFENTVAKDLIGTKVSLGTFQKNSSDVMKTLGRKGVNFFKGIPATKNLSPAIENLSFLSLNDSIVCIDDLERRGSGLQAKDVMGLVSHLKEQKNCKVILLLNAGESGLSDFERYREKVLDYELTFEPTPEECASIAYENDTPYTARLKELVIKLGIRNIRVLKKIERLLVSSLPMVEDLEPEIYDQLIHTLALYTWSYYCSENDSGIPPLQSLCERGYSFSGFGEDERTDEEKVWDSVLNDYGYVHTDELDLVLAESVKSGFFDQSCLLNEALKKNEQVKASKSEGSFSRAWGLYHDSFGENDEEVINGLYESFMNNCRHVSPVNLNGLVTLFRELDEDQKATEVINKYIEVRGTEMELFDPRKGSIFFGDKVDDELSRMFADHVELSRPEITAIEVLERISGKNGWGSEDELVLSNTTAEQYYDLFKSINGPELSSYVNTCLQFGRFGNASESQQRIANNAESALRRIAEESELNRRRVRKFDIDV